MYYDDDDHDPYFRIGKGKEPRKNNEIRTSLAYLTYLYLSDNNCYKPCPVSCLHSAYIPDQESLNKVDKGVEIVYSRISSGNYFTCMYQSAVNICESVTDRTK